MMQSRWAILASPGKITAQRRQHRSLLRLELSARPFAFRRPLSTHVGQSQIASREWCSSRSRWDENKALHHTYHSGSKSLNNRPLHTTSPKTSPVAQAFVVDEVDDFLRNDDAAEDNLQWSTISGASKDVTDSTSRKASFLEEDVNGYNRKNSPGRAIPVSRSAAHETIKNFDPFNPPSTDNLEEMQLWLEVQAQQESVSKYEKIVKDALDRKDFASLGLVQRQVIKWYQDLKNEIEQEQRRYLTEKLVDVPKGLRTYGPFLCSLQPEKLAVITAHVALVQCMLRKEDHSTVLFLAKKIGAAVECEVNVQRAVRKLVEESRLEMQQGWDDNVEDQTHDHIVDEGDQTVDMWAYGPSHLRKFLEDSTGSGRGSRARSAQYANERARKILNLNEHWGERDQIKVGVALLEILLNTARTCIPGHKEENAFIYEKRLDMEKPHMGRRKGVVFLNETLYKVLANDDSLSFAPLTDRFKPMVLPPRDWTSATDGAYCWVNVSLMRTGENAAQKFALQNADLTMALDGLNSLGRVPWVINRKILNIAQHCWDANIALGDIPSRTDFDLPPKPVEPDRSEWVDDQESDEFKEQGDLLRTYRTDLKTYLRTRQRNMDLRSLRCSAILKLHQAKQFQIFEKIYFPFNMDFRGRAYPVPPHLSTVGSDMCRGMLKFAKSKPLGDRGLYWIKVHLANLAGNDKMSFDGRAEFTEQNMDNIRAAVEDPFGQNQWWMSLDDPFQGLATCHELVNAIDSGDPASYESSLPIHMDGSCNGLQHYAALGRDKEGGQAVNLCRSDEPSDVYSGVREEVEKRVAEEAAIDLDFDESEWDGLSEAKRGQLKRNRSAKLVDGLIDRGVVKRTVMTSVYGVTYIGARIQIQEKIVEKLEERGYDAYENEMRIHEASGYLASVTMEVMGELFSGARQTMNWLTACARLIAQQGQPVSWFSPIGIPVVQPYRQKKLVTMHTVLQDVVLIEQNDDIPAHKARQTTAFPPNYVHSLDSSHMILTALEMKKRGLTFSAVHDSFWTHACDVDEMNEALRESFVELYKQPLLERLKEEWELRFPSIEFPDLPEKGDLDLNDVKSAPYFFQ